MNAPAELDPILAAERVDDMIARVSTAPGGKANAAITDADIRMLCDLPVRVRADALERLGAVHGVTKRPLHASIKMEEQNRKTRARRPAPDSWTQELVPARDGDVAAVFPNVCTILRHAYAERLAYDRMGNRPFVDGRPLDDSDILRMRDAFGRQWATFSKEDIADACSLVGRETCCFHPVTDYLCSIEWDGVPRLATAAYTIFQLPRTDRLSAIMFKRTLIAGVARAFAQETAAAPEATLDEKRGVKCDTVLTFAGWQGAQKSEFIGVMGGPFAMASPAELDNRRGPITMHCYWLVEWAEVDRYVSKQDNSETKKYIGPRVDTIIPIYGKSPIDMMRGYIPMGTTNVKRFLTDATGDRRWWVISLFFHGKDWQIDLVLVASLRDQLWAEAHHEYREYKRLQREGVPNRENPHRFFLNREEEQARRAQCAEHQQENAWAEPAIDWLDGKEITCLACKGAKRVNDFPCRSCGESGKVQRRDALRKMDDGREYVTLYELLGQCLGVPPERHPSNYGRAADTLTGIGWLPPDTTSRRGPEKIDKKPSMTTRYLRPLDDDEVAEEELRAAMASTTPEEAEAQAAELEARAAELRRAHGLGAAREETAADPTEEAEFFGEETNE